MDLLSVIEKHKTKTDRIKSLTVKVVVTQTINTSLIYGILYLINGANPLGSLGLVNKIINLVVVSGIVNLLVCIIPPGIAINYILNKFTLK